MTAIKNETTTAAINNDMTSAAVVDQTKRMTEEAEAVYRLLDDCIESPGADIIIQVRHADGRQAVAALYDSAALVQELQSALKYFISQL